MTREEFKQMFIKVINFGWSQSIYFSHLNAVANDDAQLAKLHNMCNIVAHHNCISTHYALYTLIRRGFV